MIPDYLRAVSILDRFDEEIKSDPKRWSQIATRLGSQNSKRFQEAMRKAGIEGRMLHSLRHSFALRMWVQLGDIYLVKRLLGHSAVTTTEIYTKFPVDYLKEISDLRAKIDGGGELIGMT